MKSPIGRNAQWWSNFVEHSVHKMPGVNKEVMFQRVYGSLSTSVFDRIGVCWENCSACVRHGYCSQALLSSDGMDLLFIF